MSLWKGSSLAILRALHRGARSVSDIVRETELSQSNVSNHLARLREGRLVLAHRAGKQVFYEMTDFALAQFVQARTLQAGSLAAAINGQVVARALPHLQAYVAALREERSDLALQAVYAAMAEGLSWQDVYLHLFGPALERVGALWEARELSVAEEHAATALTERMMSRLVQPERPPWMERVGSAVVACVEGETHSVGARMVADFFTAAGWSVHYLGADLPLEDLVCFVTDSRPDVVALSVSMVEHGESLRRTVARLRALRGDAPLPLLLAGGQALAFGNGALAQGLDVAENDVRRAIRRAEAIVREQSQ